jgi:putative Flp pilus-assembly TadE/G-like protein
MNHSTIRRPSRQVTTMQPARSSRRARRDERGQIIVVAALAMVVIIAGVSLVLEGGNAYAHQRVVQNAADAVANSGATVIAERLGGAIRTDADIHDAMSRLSSANALNGYDGYYTDVTGQMLTPAGVVTSSRASAAAVGGGTIPSMAQGVLAAGSQSFDTTFARVIGFNQFTASADATAVAGALTGGQFMPVVFPVSMKNCDGSGDLIQDVDADWRMSNPPVPPSTHPSGQEFLIPLCKTGAGSFMILNLDPTKSCYQEVVDPSSIQYADFPVDIPVDVGNNCAKEVEQGVVDASLQGKVVLIPICDGECTTDSGSNATYHIVRITAFWLDYLSYSNNTNNSWCKLITSPTYNTSIVNIVGGNGSASCMAGWFVRYVTSGPVGKSQITNGEAIGVQLIR